MSWVRTDDGEAHDPKMLAVSLGAYGLNHAAKGYASRHMTDGFIPRQALPALHPSSPRNLVMRCAQELVKAGLWEQREDGWQIQDYLQFNPPRAQVLEQRAAAHEDKVRAGRIGGRRSGEVRGSKTQADAKQAASPPLHSLEADAKQGQAEGAKQNEAPSRPVPSRKEEEPPQPPNGGRDPAHDWLDLLNRRTGRCFRPSSGNLRPILARLREGFTFAQAEAVVDAKVSEWSPDPKMAMYLCPTTLFGTKFERYVQALNGVVCTTDRSYSSRWADATQGEVKL